MSAPTQIHNEASARQYITDKHLIQLMRALTTSLAYSKPEDPISFLKKVISDLKTARDGNGSVLVCFTPENIKAMFTVLDPFNKGTVTKEQLYGALLNFGSDPEVADTVIGEGKPTYDIDEFSELIIQAVQETLFPK